jgi:hypothetical protein
VLNIVSGVGKKSPKTSAAAAAKDICRNRPSPDFARRAGSTFQGIGSTIAMTRANGRQAIAEAAYGTTHRKSVTGQIELVDVHRFPPDCVNPPDGVTTLKWIGSGFSGGRC